MNKSIINNLKAFLLPLIVYLLFLIPFYARFGSMQTFYTLLVQSVVPTIMGFGVAFSWMSGIIDFSIGSKIILASVIGGVLAQYMGLWGIIIGCMGASLVLGLITAVVNRYLRIPSLVVTLGLTMIFEVLAQIIRQKAKLTILKREDTILGQPFIMLIGLFITAFIFYIIFYHTKASYHIRAIGKDMRLSQNIGIDIEKTKMLSFIIGSVFLGIAAVIQVSNTGMTTVQTNLDSARILFKPLMGVLVGLTLTKFCNISMGIYLGSFAVNTLFLGLLAASGSDIMQDVALGVFILVVMSIDVIKSAINRILVKINFARNRA